MTFLEEIGSKIESATEIWTNEQKSPAISRVVSQLISEAWQATQMGEWSLAVKFSHHAHEIARAHECDAWFDTLTAISNARNLVNSPDSIQKLGVSPDEIFSDVTG